MAKKNKSQAPVLDKHVDEIEESIEDHKDSHGHVENIPPFIPWNSFEEFWMQCVKGGSNTIKDAAKEHIKALGCEKKPETWIECLKHFGVDVES